MLRLFSSLHRGYPVGSLLFYKRPASAARIPLGPLLVEASEQPEAWWVVDGQQRLTALTAGLARPLPLPERPQRDDPYVVYFDAASQTFEAPPKSGEVPPSWVPLPVLLDPSGLSEWVHSWSRADVVGERRAVFDASTRLREYSLPLYVIEGRDEDTVKEIFYRVNTAGRPLAWTDVHKALFGAQGDSPATLEELWDELAKLGMGRLTAERTLSCLLAMRKEDPTRTLGEHFDRNPEVLTRAVAEAVPVFQSVLSFLRKDAGIPHLRLLPQATLLDVLVRFFAVHPAPNPRVRTLLARWFWRVVFGAGIVGSLTLRRRGIQAIDEQDAERSVQKLLALVRQDRARLPDLPASFDGRAEQSRIALLTLASLSPRDLSTGRPVELGPLIEAEGRSAFPALLPRATHPLARGAANRTIHPGAGLRAALLRRIRSHGRNDVALVSHLVDPTAAAALSRGRDGDFLEWRAKLLDAALRRFYGRKCEWEHSDRPSIDYLLASVEAAS